MFVSLVRSAALAVICLLTPFQAIGAVPKPDVNPFGMAASALLKAAPAAAQFPDAGAITLRDESTVHLNADGSSVEVTHETFKIFNQRGRAKAEIAISYNASNETVTQVHARTIKPDGSVLIASAGDIHESAPFSQFAMYDNAKVIGISMPGVEDGAIIDYLYTRTTTKSYLPGQYSTLWSFRDDQNPVKLSKLTLTAPASLQILTQPHNADALSTTQKVSPDGKEKTYVWEMSSMDPLIPEPMMPPANTFLPWEEVSTVPGWQTIAHWYQGLATGQMTVSPEIRDTVKTLIAGKTTDTDKARAIYYWVEGQTRYVALELGLSAFQPHPAAEVSRNRYGDCKDMATLLLTMLHEAGIKTAWPVLLGAGNTELVHDRLAAPIFFNHAIVRADIDGKPYWLDSTAEMCTFGEIPGGDRGVDAFVIRDGVGQFETIPVGTPDNNAQAVTTKVALNADGSADCETVMQLVGDYGLQARLAFRGLQPSQLQPVFQNMVSGFSPNASLTSVGISVVSDRDQPVAFDIKYHAPLWATRTGHLLIINGKDLTTAPYDRPSRVYPIYTNHVDGALDTTIVTIPANFTLSDKPDDLDQATPLGYAKQSVTLTGNTLTIRRVGTSLPGEIAPADYAAAKARQEKIVALRKQPIVLQQIVESK